MIEILNVEKKCASAASASHPQKSWGTMQQRKENDMWPSQRLIRIAIGPILVWANRRRLHSRSLWKQSDIRFSTLSHTGVRAVFKLCAELGYYRSGCSILCKSPTVHNLLMWLRVAPSVNISARTKHVGWKVSRLTKHVQNGTRPFWSVYSELSPRETRRQVRQSLWIMGTFCQSRTGSYFDLYILTNYKQLSKITFPSGSKSHAMKSCLHLL